MGPSTTVSCLHLIAEVGVDVCINFCDVFALLYISLFDHFSTKLETQTAKIRRRNSVRPSVRPESSLPFLGHVVPQGRFGAELLEQAFIRRYTVATASVRSHSSVATASVHSHS